MGKAAIIFVLGSIILYTVFNTDINRSINFGYDVTVDRFTEIQAKHTAISMVNFLLSWLAEDNDFRVTQPITIDVLNGSVTYRVVDTVLVIPDTLKYIKIVVNSNYYDRTHIVTAYKQLDGWVHPFAREAWIANAGLNKTMNDMYIDGNDLDLNIFPGAEQFVVSSSTFFTNIDNAAIGVHSLIDGVYQFVECQKRSYH